LGHRYGIPTACEDGRQLVSGKSREKVKITSERAKEMYNRIVALGNAQERKTHKTLSSGEATCTTIGLDVTMPEVLVSLGVATTEEEASEFIVWTVKSTLRVQEEGIIGRNEASGSLVNFGFFLGLLAAKCGGGKGVN